MMTASLRGSCYLPEAGGYIKYYLIKNAILFENICVISYGVMVKKKNRRRGQTLEHSAVFDITTRHKKAIAIIEKLIYGQVTPCTLHDVVYDLIS
jgi:hypothetical protein